MDYTTFKKTFTKDVKRAFAKMGRKMEFSAQTMTKPNENYDALTVKPSDSNVGVNINLDNFYKVTEENGMDYDDAVNKAVETVLTALDNGPQFDIPDLTDYSKMKQFLAVEVVSAETNKDLLETVPHQIIEDLAVVYRFVLSSENDCRSSILVNNRMLETMSVTPEQLHADAVANAAQYRPLIIKGMSEVISEMMGISPEEMGLPQNPADEKIFVATVSDKVQGAGVLAYEDFLDRASKRAGGDFYLLPSSIHELLIVPDTGDMSLKNLEDMVREVNATQVEPQDRLTDNVYHYDAENRVFELGEKFVARKTA